MNSRETENTRLINIKRSDLNSKKRIAQLCEILGTNIRLERKVRGFTSEILAEFLGISTAYIGLIERGERCPSLDTFLRIGDFFGVSYENLTTPRLSEMIQEPEELAYLEEQKKTRERKFKNISAMLNSFTNEELDDITTIVKALRSFGNERIKSINDDDGDLGEYAQEI